MKCEFHTSHSTLHIPHYTLHILFPFPDFEHSREIILLICAELLFAHLVPALAPFREEHVAIDIGKHAGHVQFFHEGHRVAVHGGAANDKALTLAGGASLVQGKFEATANDATRSLERRVPREHVVRAVRERPPDIIVVLATKKLFNYLNKTTYELD